MGNTSSLLDRIVDAHGGDRWAEASSISATRHFGGAFWALKQVPGIAEEGRFTVDLRRQRSSLEHFGADDLRTEFTGDHVAVVRSTLNGDEIVEKLANPRASFAGHVLETPWNRLQLAYFTGYAMWTYNTEPWSFTFPGVTVEEAGTWTEPTGEVWDRLRVTYPESIATHTPTQTLYADADGVLRRRDYEVDIAGASPSVEYMTGQTWFDGLLLPTERRIFVRDESGQALPEPLIVSIQIESVVVE
ncbi:hypothetical protein JG550_003550 [Curtobacterium flaccumfaciens pv. flaccumfaciens]|uniref:hypothetical protein n=1 Tax=Curtobacterium flaccumfaciens TaxID=2035 RepID=UPI001ADBB32C|nr:hypothetical protein [Curtobacterium flaccumfaciens]MBO9046064.1 hypothetical protein [Curtobacterium flaccumfaciens pv. flaccumfaciens]QTR90781.1 hypothetical protein JG550_003550 [Curtobacterium flaccumfaciens pv. flaccumfaciens]QVG66101.1 hypothetical protein JG551_003583 [Curtobacterium flaccumfaciens pv. flaccumfaciens]